MKMNMKILARATILVNLKCPGLLRWADQGSSKMPEGSPVPRIPSKSAVVIPDMNRAERRDERERESCV